MKRRARYSHPAPSPPEYGASPRSSAPVTPGFSGPAIPSSSPRFTPRLAGATAALILLAVVAYSPVLRAGYIWDDDALTENPQVHSAAGLADIWLNPGANRFEAHYWPVTYTTFWIEARLWGRHPAGYHLTNLLLHALNAALLFLLLRRMKIAVAWPAAAVFAVHPIHVESVAWIIERKDVLSSALYLGALLFFVRHREERRPAAYALALACFVAAMLSKSIAVSFPLAAAIWLWWRDGKVSKRDVLALAPFLGIAVLIAFLDVRFAGQRETARFGFSLVERIGIAGRAIAWYAGKVVWPYPLMTFYPRWSVAMPPAWPLLFPAAVGAALLGLWAARKRIGRGPVALALYFCVTLGPVLGLIDFHFMSFAFVADRFQYLASAGLIVLVCAAALRFRERLPAPGGRVLATGLSYAVLAVLAFLTLLQSSLYRNNETLFRHNVARNPNAWAARNILGVAIESRARSAANWDEAMEHFQKAVEANPGFPDARSNYGVALGRRGRYDEAIEQFRAAIRVKPNSAEAWGNMGYAMLSKGDPTGAVESLEKAIDLRPDSATYTQNLAYARLALGDEKGAVAAFEQTLALDPGRAAAANRLAWILATSTDDTLRDGPRAVGLAERACERVGDPGAAYLDVLAAAYAEAGRFDDAVATAKQALDLARQRALSATGPDQVARKEQADEIEARLRLYESGKPCRESATR